MSIFQYLPLLHYISEANIVPFTSRHLPAALVISFLYFFVILMD